jgi:hypothetical protein
MDNTMKKVIWRVVIIIVMVAVGAASYFSRESP